MMRNLELYYSRSFAFIRGPIDSLEFVPQAELEHARIDERSRVLPETRGIQNAGIRGVWIEPHRIRHVEGLGAELDRVRIILDGKKMKPFPDTQVDTKEAIAAD